MPKASAELLRPQFAEQHIDLQLNPKHDTDPRSCATSSPGHCLMKSLWSKAGQAHRCGCRACKTAVTGAGQRVTAPRRKPTFAEIFTAAYSSVFASAAIVDAVRKDERRRDLDRQLEDARRELAELQQQNGSDDMGHESLESSISRLTDRQMNALWQNLKAGYKARPHDSAMSHPVAGRASKLGEKLQSEHYGCPDEASMNLLRSTDLNRLEEAILLEETNRSIRRRDPRSEKQMQRLSESILRLIRRMMEQTKHLSKDPSPCPSFDEAAKMLRAGFPRYTYAGIDPDRACDNNKRLNSANRAAIHNPELGLREKIGRICYNMLISAYPPGMSSLNSLIVAFDHWGYHYLAESVVDTFFHDSLFMPTLLTYPAILHHYRATRDYVKFMRTIACIAGLDGTTGAKYRRRHISELEYIGATLNWAGNTEQRTVTGEWVWQHAPLNRLMVEEILRGLFQGRMCGLAVSFFASCMQTGVYLTSKVAKQVLDECLLALDWKAAVQLIHEFSKHQEVWTVLLSSRDDETIAYVVDRVYSLLDLIGLGISRVSISEQHLASLGISRKDLATFVDNISMANSRLPAALVVPQERGDGGATKSRLLQMESIDRELVRVRKKTKSLESEFIKRFPPEFRIPKATYISGTAIEDAQRLGEEIPEVFRAERQIPVETEEVGVVDGDRAQGVEIPALVPEEERHPTPVGDVAGAPQQHQPKPKSGIEEERLWPVPCTL